MQQDFKSTKRNSQKWRLFASLPLHVEETLALSEEEHHYAHHVLRLQEGALVELSNDQGELANAQIVAISKKGTQVKIVTLGAQDHFNPAVDLIVGLPKPTALEETIQIAAELGARRLIFFKADHSHSKGTEKSEKWEKQAREALRISKATVPLKISVVANLEAALLVSKVTAAQKDGHNPSLCFVCDEQFEPSWSHDGDETACFGDVLAKQLKFFEGQNAHGSLPEVQVVVGPEASFSAHERQYLATFAPNYVSLGPLILRVPAATGYALAVALDKLRSWQSRSQTKKLK
jgi:16S rRNA (uracil1498-N3)-methyltransferase